MSELFDSFLSKPLLVQYIWIGLLFYATLMISVVVGIFRSIIEFATVEHPKMENIKVAPCLTLLEFRSENTDEPQIWIAQAVGNILVFIIGGAFGVVLGWGLIPFLIAQNSISNSRKKRFG